MILVVVVIVFAVDWSGLDVVVVIMDIGWMDKRINNDNNLKINKTPKNQQFFFFYHFKNFILVTSLIFF